MKIHLSKFINSKTGKILMSILLGFGFATFFRATCEGSDCIIRVGPKADKLKDDAVYAYNDKCYSFKKTSSKCIQKSNGNQTQEIIPIS
jgi:hypothetical protein